jgi:hypothetical protein
MCRFSSSAQIFQDTAGADSKVPLTEILSHPQSTHPKGFAIVFPVEPHPEVDFIQTQAMFELLSWRRATFSAMVVG